MTPKNQKSPMPDLNVDRSRYKGRNANWLNRQRGLIAPVVYSDVDEAWKRTGL
jgi:hypothetical protein